MEIIQKDIITVSQLPVIEQHLALVKEEFDKMAAEALALPCSPETVKTVKEMRADINRYFTDLEDRRKAAKNAVLKPYNDFEEVYKRYVTYPHKLLDTALKGKIESVECEMRDSRRTDIETYFNECCEATGIDFLKFEDAGIKITMSASIKSLKEQVQAFIFKISGDICSINTLREPEEYMDEYLHNGYDLSRAIEAVNGRRERIRTMELRAAAAPEPKPEPKPTHFSEPVVVDEKEYTVSFKVTATKSKLTELKQFLIDGGYKYDN